MIIKMNAHIQTHKGNVKRNIKQFIPNVWIIQRIEAALKLKISILLFKQIIL